MITPKKAPYSDTSVDPDRTIAEINKMLRAYGISNYQWTTMWERHVVQLRFAIETAPGKGVMIRVSPPTFLAKRRTWDAKAGRHVVVEAPNWAQSLRLLLYWLKAKVESVAYGLREVEEEFLADILVKTPDGREATVAELVRPALESGEAELVVPALKGETEGL
jgi:hypothetical protein